MDEFDGDRMEILERTLPGWAELDDLDPLTGDVLARYNEVAKETDHLADLYLDDSMAKFMRTLAHVIGLRNPDRFMEVRADLMSAAIKSLVVGAWDGRFPDDDTSRKAECVAGLFVPGVDNLMLELMLLTHDPADVDPLARALMDVIAGEDPLIDKALDLGRLTRLKKLFSEDEEDADDIESRLVADGDTEVDDVDDFDDFDDDDSDLDSDDELEFAEHDEFMKLRQENERSAAQAMGLTVECDVAGQRGPYYRSVAYHTDRFAEKCMPPGVATLLRHMARLAVTYAEPQDLVVPPTDLALFLIINVTFNVAEEGPEDASNPYLVLASELLRSREELMTDVTTKFGPALSKGAEIEDFPPRMEGEEDG